MLIEAKNGAFAGCISATANLNPDLCQRAWSKGEQSSLDAAVTIRKLFDGKALVSGVKALLAHIHADPALSRVKPPLAPFRPPIAPPWWRDTTRCAASAWPRRAPPHERAFRCGDRRRDRRALRRASSPQGRPRRPGLRADPQIIEVGAGLVVSPNASRLLIRLGLGDELERIGVRPLAFHQRRWQDGRTLARSRLREQTEATLARRLMFFTAAN